MAKIQCPHCKAVNQDVSMDDPCWQCGTVLSAPPSALDTPGGVPSSEANPANRLGSSSAPIQKQIDREQGKDRPAASESKGSGLNTGVIAIAALVLALIVILLVVWLKTRH